MIISLFKQEILRISTYPRHDRTEENRLLIEAAEARGREGRIIERLVEVADGVCGPHPVPESTTDVIELLNAIERAYTTERLERAAAARDHAAREKASVETIERQDERLTAVRKALAGLPDVEPYPEDDEIDEHERSLRTGGRVIPPEEQIRRLRVDLEAAKDLAEVRRVGLTAERENTGAALHRLALAQNELEALKNPECIDEEPDNSDMSPEYREALADAHAAYYSVSR